MPIATPRLTRAAAALLAPVPPSATVMSVMPVIVPLVTVRFVRVDPSALSVAIVPSPNVVLCAAALKSSNRARPAAVQTISSIIPAFALLRPSKRSVAVTFWTLA